MIRRVAGALAIAACAVAAVAAAGAGRAGHAQAHPRPADAHGSNDQSGDNGPERTSVLENDTVAVTKLHFAAGAGEAVHTHPFPIVIVQLTSGNTTVKDREMLRVGARAGETWFIAAGTPHGVRNGPRGPVDMLALALKPDRAPAPAAPPTEAPEGITRATLIDNADVRVVRVRFAPGASEPRHSHPNDLLTVQVTSGRVDILNGADRTARDCEPGFVQFLPRDVPHAYANAGPRPFELLSISIK